MYVVVCSCICIVMYVCLIAILQIWANVDQGFLSPSMLCRYLHTAWDSFSPTTACAGSRIG